MKFLTDRKEIAKALNFGEYPILDIDIDKAKDGYAVGCDVKVAYNTRNYGELETQGNIIVENGKEYITNNAVCIKSSFGVRDVQEMIRWAKAPVVRAGQEVAVVRHSTEYGVFTVEIMKISNRIDAHCQIVAELEHIEE